MENHCPNNMIGTYNGKYNDSSKSYGGYSDYSRASSHFVLNVPDAISAEDVAPCFAVASLHTHPWKRTDVGQGRALVSLVVVVDWNISAFCAQRHWEQP